MPLNDEPTPNADAAQEFLGKQIIDKQETVASLVNQLGDLGKSVNSWIDALGEPDVMEYDEAGDAFIQKFRNSLGVYVHIPDAFEVEKVNIGKATLAIGSDVTIFNDGQVRFGTGTINFEYIDPARPDEQFKVVDFSANMLLTVSAITDDEVRRIPEIIQIAQRSRGELETKMYFNSDGEAVKVVSKLTPTIKIEGARQIPNIGTFLPMNNEDIEIIKIAIEAISKKVTEITHQK